MQNLKIIKKTIEEFFKKTGFEIILESLSKKDKTIMINIKTEEPQILIGENGQTLNEIQYLLKIILRKQIIAKNEPCSEHFYLNIDINDYKKKKKEYLEATACLAADEVSSTKKEKELAPMTAYERRIVHLVLTERQDIVTESIGEMRDERRVVIKPKP